MEKMKMGVKGDLGHKSRSKGKKSPPVKPPIVNISHFKGNYAKLQKCG